MSFVLQQQKYMTSNHTQHDKQSNNINMNDSPMMNSNEMEIFLNVRRSRSDQSMLGRLFSQPGEGQRTRALIINIPTPINSGQMTNFKLFRKIRKEKKKNQSDYCKNICGYITKKIIRELCSPNYANHVKQLCDKYSCDYKQLKNFYLPKIEQVTGPSHIPSLLIADSQQQQKIKEAFKEFFQWFIKSRYLRYLLNEGKMADKKAYIKYKNHMLLSMLKQSKNLNANNGKHQNSQESQQESQSMEDESEEDQQERKTNTRTKLSENKSKAKQKIPKKKPNQSKIK